jgi:hypothetical protein
MATPLTVDERLELAEKRLEELQRKRRDSWDKFQIVASLLIPASITLAGYLYSEAAKQAEITSGERIAAQQQATSQIQAKVGQAQLVSTFMEALLSDNSQRQRLAIEAVLVALPEDGPRLVAIVSLDKSRPVAQAAALSSLDQRRSRLIQDCFSNDKATRIRATTELVQVWQADEKLVPELLATARQKQSNSSGAINALVILENVTGGALAPHQDEIKSFLDSVRSAGPQTETHVKQVEARLGLGKASQ